MSTPKAFVFNNELVTEDGEAIPFTSGYPWDALCDVLNAGAYILVTANHDHVKDRMLAFKGGGGFTLPVRLETINALISHGVELKYHGMGLLSRTIGQALQKDFKLQNTTRVVNADYDADRPELIITHREHDHLRVYTLHYFFKEKP